MAKERQLLTVCTFAFCVRVLFRVCFVYLAFWSARLHVCSQEPGRAGQAAFAPCTESACDMPTSQVP